MKRGICHFDETVETVLFCCCCFVCELVACTLEFFIDCFVLSGWKWTTQGPHPRSSHGTGTTSRFNHPEISRYGILNKCVVFLTISNCSFGLGGWRVGGGGGGGRGSRYDYGQENVDGFSKMVVYNYTVFIFFFGKKAFHDIIYYNLTMLFFSVGPCVLGCC